MANSMRRDADDAYKGKLDRMGLGISTSTTGPKTTGHQRSMADGTEGEASGGRAEGYASEADNERMLDEKTPKRLRLDRKPYKNGGAVKKGTTVNVIVAPQGGGESAAPPPMPPGPPPPMMKPPGPAMGPPGGPPEMPGMGAPMMRKHGGRVPHIISDGAGGGKGRLQKVDAYGDRAKPSGKAGTM
jgi:hypothetical protein